MRARDPVLLAPVVVIALDGRIATRDDHIMPTYEYATNPKTGTIHVRHPHGAIHLRTLCGQWTGAAWSPGALTVSASDATCARCRQIARSKARRIDGR